MKRLIGLLLLVLAACIDKDEMPLPLNADQVARLLSADTSKSWQLSDRFEENMMLSPEPCELDNQLVFFSNDTLNFISGEVLCANQPDSLISQMRWFVIENEQQLFFDSLGLISDEVVDFEIDSVEDENGNLVSTDTMDITEPDTTFYVIERITSRFLRLTFSADGTLLTEQYEARTNE